MSPILEVEERQQLIVNLFKKTTGLLLTVRDNILY